MEAYHKSHKDLRYQHQGQVGLMILTLASQRRKETKEKQIWGRDRKDSRFREISYWERSRKRGTMKHRTIRAVYLALQAARAWVRKRRRIRGLRRDLLRWVWRRRLVMMKFNKKGRTLCLRLEMHLYLVMQKVIKKVLRKLKNLRKILLEVEMTIFYEEE